MYDLSTIFLCMLAMILLHWLYLSWPACWQWFCYTDFIWVGLHAGNDFVTLTFSESACMLAIILLYSTLLSPPCSAILLCRLSTCCFRVRFSCCMDECLQQTTANYKTITKNKNRLQNYKRQQQMTNLWYSIKDYKTRLDDKRFQN